MGGVKNSIDLNPPADLVINGKAVTTAGLLWEFDIFNGYEFLSVVLVDEAKEEVGTASMYGSLHVESAYAVDEWKVD